MKVKDLIDYCNAHSRDHCYNCDHIDICDKFEQQYGTIPFFMNKRYYQWRYGFNFKQEKEKEII